MKRKDFIRNALMALCVTMLPKNLLPSVADVEEEEGFIGIIPAIERSREWVMYASQEFIDTWNEYLRNMTKVLSNARS